jgi:hypothetical protein
VEVLVVTLILAVGLAAVAIGLQHATSGIDTGKDETTAVFLAEQRLEQLKAVALADWSSPILNAATTVEGSGSLLDGPSYRRVTTITDGAGSTCPASCKVVQVTIFYRPVTGRGQLDQERRLDVVTMLASRL